MRNLRWNGDDLLLLLKDKVIPQMLSSAGLLIEGQAKVNITNNGQVDTGFMRNSVYSVSPKGDSYSNVSPIADKTAFGVTRPPSGGAVVSVAAEYGLFQEMRMPFLYPAVETVAATMSGQIVNSGKSAL